MFVQNSKYNPGYRDIINLSSIVSTFGYSRGLSRKKSTVFEFSHRMGEINPRRNVRKSDYNLSYRWLGRSTKMSLIRDSLKCPPSSREEGRALHLVGCRAKP
jgi:hypothetical protein